MVITKRIEIRLYPNKGQRTMINKNIGGSRVAYNVMLRTKEELYRDYGINFDPKWWLLKEDIPWMAELDSRVLNSAHRNLNKAYQEWFKSFKGGAPKGHPQYKKKSKKGSYQNTSMPTVPEKLFRAGGIFIPKVGVVKFKSHWDLSGIRKIRNLTIKRSSTGKYFCVICCDVEIQEFDKTGAVVGLDLGVKDLIISSDGTKYENKKFLKKTEKKIKHLQRSVSRKKKGSKNREKAKTILAIAHEKLGNKRKDYLQKLTTSIVRDNDVICIEDLNVKGMLKNHCLAKSIADASFSEIRRMLKYKCTWYGKELVVIDRWEPTSKKCNHCGHIMGKFDLGIREWTCPNCHTHHDRDINAAHNILEEGLRLTKIRQGMPEFRPVEEGVQGNSSDRMGALALSLPVKQELYASSTEEVEHGR